MNINDFFKVIKQSVLFYPDTAQGRVNGFAVLDKWQDLNSLNLSSSYHLENKNLFFSRTWAMAGYPASDIEPSYPLLAIVFDRFIKTERGLKGVFDIGIVVNDQYFTEQDTADNFKTENRYKAAFLLSGVFSYLKHSEIWTVDGVKEYGTPAYFIHLQDQLGKVVNRDDVATARFDRYFGFEIESNYFPFNINSQLYGVVTEMTVKVDDCLSYKEGDTLTFDYANISKYQNEIILNRNGQIEV